MGKIPTLAAILALAALALWVLSEDRAADGPISSAAAEPLRPAASGDDERDASGLERRDATGAVAANEPATAPPARGGWLLHGTVMDADGRALPGITLRLMEAGLDGWGSVSRGQTGPGARELAHTITGADGGYVFHFAEPPWPDIIGFVRNKPCIASDDPAWQPAADGLGHGFQPHGGKLDLILRSGPCLLGRLLTPRGEPAADAMVFVVVDLIGTDADGRFRLAMPQGDSVELRFRHPSGVLRLPKVELSETRDVDLGDLSLCGDGAFAGRVELPDGSPAPHVWLAFEPLDLLQRDPGVVRDWWEGGHDYWSVRTDAEGRFRAEGLRLVPHRITCRYLDARIPLLPRAAPEGALPHYTPSGEGTVLQLELPWRLLIVDVPAAAEGYATIRYEAHGVAPGAAPDPDAFRLLAGSSVQPSELPIVVMYDAASWLRVAATVPMRSKGHALIAVQPEPWLTRAVLAMEPNDGYGTVRIRPGAESNLEVERLVAGLRDAESGATGAPARRRAAEEQAIELLGVAPGRWQLTLSLQPFTTWPYALPETLPVQVRAGETTEVEWTPRIGGLLEVCAALDPPADDAPVHLRALVLEGPAHSGNRLNFARTRGEPAAPDATRFPPDAAALVAGVLEPGQYRLRLEAEGYAPAEASVTVVAGEMARLDTTLRPDTGPGKW